MAEAVSCSCRLDGPSHSQPDHTVKTTMDVTDAVQTNELHGKDAWMTLVGAWLIQFCTYGYVSAFGIYQDYYTRYFLSHQTPSAISWIGSVQLFLQYAAGLFVGLAFDAGFFHHIIAVGTFLQICSMYMLSLAHQDQYYQVFLAQGVGMGLGQALLFIPSLTIIGRQFKTRRALATGVAVSGASVGGVVWPLLLHKLREETSFANAIRVTAAMSSVMLLASNFMIRTPTQVSRIPATWSRPKFGVVFSDLPYVVSVASAFCINLGIFFPYFYLQLFVITNVGVDESLALYSIVILNAGGILGRLLPSLIADRFGSYNMLLISLSISSALAFVMFGLKNFAGVVFFALCYGFWSGAYVSLIPCLLAQLTPSPKEHGTRIGLAFSIVGVSLLIGNPIEGALLRLQIDGYYDWSKSIVFYGSLIICGTVGMAVSRSMFISQGRAGPRGQRI